MARLPSAKAHYQYVTDKGDIFRVRIQTAIATQVDGAGDSIIGAVAAAGTEAAMPSGGKLRRAIVRDLVNKVDRVVPILKPSAPMIQVPFPAGSQTLTLNRNLDSYVYTYQGDYLTETRGRRG